MTRFEMDAAYAAKGCKVKGFVNMVQKIKTKNDYVYTIADYQYKPESLSEQGMFELLCANAYAQMEGVKDKLFKDKFYWSPMEGRMFSADSIKEIWIEFNDDPEQTMRLDGTSSMMPAQDPACADAPLKALSDNELSQYQQMGQ